MALRFSPGTSEKDRVRIQRALEEAGQKDQEMARLIADMGPVVEIGMSETLLPHMRFQLDPVDASVSINTNVDMSDEQLAEGILTRLVAARQFGLPREIVLIENPVKSGELSKQWNKAAAGKQSPNAVPASKQKMTL